MSLRAATGISRDGRSYRHRLGEPTATQLDNDLVIKFKTLRFTLVSLVDVLGFTLPRDRYKPDFLPCRRQGTR